jgi:putative ABC transport system substrate-binding protein
MRRRDVIGLLGGAVALGPRRARAQQGGMRRVAVLAAQSENDPEPKAWLAAFQEGLQKLGWEQRRNISFDHRWAGGDQKLLRPYAAELVGSAPDLLVATNATAALELQRATRTIPIVFVQVSDPVRFGLVSSLARPGGNITGFSIFEHSIGGKWLELLKDTAPGTNRVAVLVDPDNPAQTEYLQPIKAAAPSFAVHLARIDVRSAAEIEDGIDAFAQQPNGALIVLPSVVTLFHRDLVIALAARHRLPAVYAYRLFATRGGFLSYGVDLADQ